MNSAIIITGCDGDPALERAIQELAEVLQLRAVFNPIEYLKDAVGIVAISGAGRNPGSTSLPPLPEFRFAAKRQEQLPASGEAIEFGNHPALPPFLRWRKSELGKEFGWQFLDDAGAGNVVASIGGRPVWRISQDGGRPVWSVSTPLPRLLSGERLSQSLNGETFLPLLPLYLFLHGLSSESGWQAPPLRACMVVDDPNLHARSYGYINYQALAMQAPKKDFHAAMATIPADAWWANAEAIRIFRENSGRLSLLVHGNDHLHDELARPISDAAQNGLALESLKRIGALEQRTGLRVDRVMAPPHGVCAPGMLKALRLCGYEGLTTNRWSLWKHNPTSQLPAASGLHPADMLGGGLPVVNRYRFKSSIGPAESLMAAVLRQPIIPYGHHPDFSDDMSHVHAAVKAVNSLGAVRWMSLREIMETNFEHRIEGGTFHVRMFSRRIRLMLPAGIDALQIEGTPFPDQTPVRYELSLQRGKITATIGIPTKVPAEAELEIREVASELPAAEPVRPAFGAAIVHLRRLILESRDRLRA